MLIYVATHSNYTRTACNREDALGGFGYHSKVRSMNVPEEAVCIYRVYAYDLGIDELVLTLEEAKSLIRHYHGKERRTIRRWRIPIEDGQLSLLEATK